jgi:lambda repressor-like predicted transcriptional regulator
MHVNTNVVSALLSLKGTSVSDLARVTGIHRAALESWLYREPSAVAEQDGIPIDLQVAVLAALGVRGETLRSDIVHAWYIREPLFGSARAAWAPLELVVSAFGGKAEVSYVAQDSDPVASLAPAVLYTLRFREFVATLKVTSSIFRPIQFEPDDVKGLSWMANGFGILLTSEDYAKAEDGALVPTDASEMLALADESVQWSALREAVAQLKLPPAALAQLLVQAQAQAATGGGPALAHSQGTPLAASPIPAVQLSSASHYGLPQSSGLFVLG